MLPLVNVEQWACPSKPLKLAEPAWWWTARATNCPALRQRSAQQASDGSSSAWWGSRPGAQLGKAGVLRACAPCPPGRLAARCQGWRRRRRVLLPQELGP